MKQIIKLEELPTSKRIRLIQILEKNRVKKTRKKSTSLSKYNLRSASFGVTDYLKYLTNKLKR